MRTALILLAFAFAAHAELPYPAGRTETTLEGLKTAILVPEGLDAEGAKKCSMIVLLHGLGDSGINLSRSLADRPAAGYLVVAPSTRAQAWDKADVDATIRIAFHMLKVMPVDPEKIHVMGFSNGGWNLGPLAFHEKLKPRSATYLAAGYSNGSASKWAKKNLGVLALAGEQDGNAKSAMATVPALFGKVRSVEARLQPNLGHKWPRELIPYQKWWMGTREGRYEPGKDMNFAWRDDIDAALLEVAARKGRGGVMLYVYGKEDAAPHVQNDVLMDPKVRFFGKQNPCVKLDRESVDSKKFEIKETPTLIVIAKNSKISKHLVGKSIKAKSLASALKKIAPNRKMPK